MKLIYDGDCAFCKKSADFAKRNASKEVEIIAYQKIADLSQYNLTLPDVEKRSYFIDEKNKAYGGANGMLKMGKQMKQPYKTLAYIFSLPILKQLSALVYLFVAKNRHRMPGASDDCKID